MEWNQYSATRAGVKSIQAMHKLTSIPTFMLILPNGELHTVGHDPIALDLGIETLLN